MLLGVQRCVEDLLEQRHLRDIDQYAIKVSSLYSAARSGVLPDHFLGCLNSIRTSFFRINRVDRASFEESLLNLLDRRFSGSLIAVPTDFPGPTARKRQRLAGRRSIRGLLENFKQSVETNTVDLFWDSRIEGRLRRRPEEIGEGLLATFAYKVIDGRGFLVRQFASGIGYVDIGITFGTTLHLAELKVHKGGKVTGSGQLAEYMRHNRRKYGWLVIFDSRPYSSKAPIPDLIRHPEGEVRVIVIDINPVPPSSVR